MIAYAIKFAGSKSQIGVKDVNTLLVAPFELASANGRVRLGLTQFLRVSMFTVCCNKLKTIV